LLTRPLDQKVTPDDLRTYGTPGRDSTRHLLRELISAGYLTKTRRRVGSVVYADIYLSDNIRRAASV